MLSGAALKWLVDGAAVGQGEEVALPRLELGRHEIVLQATDSHGQTATDHITLWIGDPVPAVHYLYLPVIRR